MEKNRQRFGQATISEHLDAVASATQQANLTQQGFVDLSARIEALEVPDMNGGDGERERIEKAAFGQPPQALRRAAAASA